MNTEQQTLFNNSLQHELLGGANQECKQLIETIGQIIKQPNQMERNTMEDYEQHIKTKRVYYPSYTLDPEKTTFEDIKNHAITRQNIAETTIDKYLNTAKLMETHSIFPVNFKNPHWTNFFQYMDHIKRFENATPNMLRNRRKAWALFCKAWGTDKEWPSYKLPHIPDRSKDIILPTPETVRKFFQHPYTGDKYLNRLIQYHFFTGFMVGMRPEKEMIILNIDDLYLDEPDNYTIRIVEPKKRGNSRILRLESTIAVSQTRKSFKNYVDTIRPRFANRNEDALLINPRTVTRWTESQLRLRFLYPYAQQIWPQYWPYVMRHWCATARCIEWKKDTTVLYRVKYWMGHVKLDQTLRYLDLAKLYDQGKGSWISRALKQHNNHVGGTCDISGKERTNEKIPRFVPTSPEEDNGPVGIRTRVRGSGGLCDIQATLQAHHYSE